MTTDASEAASCCCCSRATSACAASSRRRMSSAVSPRACPDTGLLHYIPGDPRIWLSIKHCKHSVPAEGDELDASSTSEPMRFFIVQYAPPGQERERAQVQAARPWARAAEGRRAGARAPPPSPSASAPPAASAPREGRSQCCACFSMKWQPEGRPSHLWGSKFLGRPGGDRLQAVKHATPRVSGIRHGTTRPGGDAAPGVPCGRVIRRAAHRRLQQPLWRCLSRHNPAMCVWYGQTVD